MEDSKQPTEEEKKAFFEQMAKEKKENEAKHPKGLNYKPQNVHMNNQKDIWSFVKSQWE